MIKCQRFPTFQKVTNKRIPIGSSNHSKTNNTLVNHLGVGHNLLSESIQCFKSVATCGCKALGPCPEVLQFITC